jgi:hypothetical protein
MERLSGQEIHKEIPELKYSREQMHLTDIYRSFYPTVTEYTFFSSGTFSNMLGHKISLKK